MQVLLVGADNKYAIERPYLKYMAGDVAVKQIDLFAAQNHFLKYYNRSIVNKILYRAGISPVLKKINRELLAEVKKKRPDFIFVFKGMELLPETLLKIKKLGITIVNYNPDNPFIFSGRGSGNKNVTNSISLYDLHFTYDTAVKIRIEEEYSIPCEILPFGFDISNRLYLQCAEETEIVKVCFLGTPDKQRAAFIKLLVARGVEIDLYGHGWAKFINDSKAKVHDAVYGDEFWKVLRKYRVQLNIMRLHNPTSHNMRSFEVPGIGGIMLAPDTADHRNYFNANEEIFLYTNVDDCVSKIKILLNSPAGKIKDVRNKVRAKSIDAGYSYEDRTKFVLQVLNKMK